MVLCCVVVVCSSSMRYEEKLLFYFFLKKYQFISINYSVIVVVLASINILNFCLWVILQLFCFLFVVVVLVCDEAY